MKLQVITHALPYLLQAAGTTVYVSLAGIALGLVLGTLVCIARVSRNPLAARTGAFYVSFFRGVPLLVQLLLIFYLLPEIGINVPAMVAAIGGLGLASGAYQAEILRGALNAVPRGQVEAALAFGFSPAGIWRRILLPQALRIATPPLISEFILLLKASSLISVVGVADLTRVSMNIASSTYRPLEAYLAAGAIYLIINLCLAAFGTAVERRLATG
jgi:polar amino acid transport system permease protein